LYLFQKLQAQQSVDRSGSAISGAAYQHIRHDAHVLRCWRPR
jgi:hypothetical protein